MIKTPPSPLLNPQKVFPIQLHKPETKEKEQKMSRFEQNLGREPKRGVSDSWSLLT